MYSTRAGFDMVVKCRQMIFFHALAGLYLWKKNGLLKVHYKVNIVEAGCDEAGRGCFAGPVLQRQ